MPTSLPLFVGFLSAAASGLAIVLSGTDAEVLSTLFATSLTLMVVAAIRSAS